MVSALAARWGGDTISLRCARARGGTALCERCGARRCGWGRGCPGRYAICMLVGFVSVLRRYDVAQRYANVGRDVEVAGHSSSMRRDGICRIERRVHTQRLRTLGGRVRAGLSSPLTSMCAQEGSRKNVHRHDQSSNDPPALLPTTISALAFLPLPRPQQVHAPAVHWPSHCYGVKFHEQRSRPLL